MVCVVTMSGRIGNDPELKTVGSEKLLNFRFANDTGFGDRKTTSWYDINYWGKGGEVAHKFIKKGSQITLSGEQKIVEFDRKDGTKGTKVEIRVNQLDFPQRESGSGGGDYKSSGSSGGGSKPAVDQDLSDEIPFVEKDGLNFNGELIDMPKRMSAFRFTA